MIRAGRRRWTRSIAEGGQRDHGAGQRRRCGRAPNAWCSRRSTIWAGSTCCSNNAGTPGTRQRITPPELDLITEDLWSQLLQTNLLGVFRGAKAAAPALKAAHGAIVSTASIAGLGRAGSSLAYSATKAGVVSLTQNLARALAPEVRVNAIAPGAVDSSWMVEWTNEERQQSIERALLKRRCQPEDLAEVVVFLGFGAAMVTGQTITVDGGLTL